MGSNFDTMSRETTSHPAALKALPIDFVPQNSSSSLGMFTSFACSDQSFFNRGQKRMTSQASIWKLERSFAGKREPRAFSEGLCNR